MSIEFVLILALGIAAIVFNIVKESVSSTFLYLTAFWVYLLFSLGLR